MTAPGADAAADVEHPQSQCRAQRLTDEAARLAAADVELVDGAERAGIRAVGVEPAAVRPSRMVLSRFSRV